MKNCSTLLALFLCAVGTDSSADILQGKITELAFTTGELNTPFETQLDVTFTHSSGATLRVPAFYNGENTFVVRFCPPQAGRWTWQSASDRKDLNARSGQMTVAASQRPGGVEIDPESATRFRYQNGDAYYPIAFEADWLFALDAENPQDIPRTRTFVKYLAESGFNQVVMNVFAYDVKWEKDDRLQPRYDFGSPAAFPFGGTNDRAWYS